MLELRPKEVDDQSVRYLPRRTAAVLDAVARACEREDFRPRTGALCGFCAFKPWCPAYGGDPTLAAAEAPVVFGRLPAPQEPVAIPA